MIRSGQNLITLAPTRQAAAPTSDNWMRPMAGIVYHRIRLRINPNA